MPGARYAAAGRRAGAFAASAEAALREGLGVNAGHDLNRANLADSAGRARCAGGVDRPRIVADALEVGL
jgi:pyridoxine 5-phosphate synthase